MLQVYFPQPDKPTHTPNLFEPINLETCLKLENYLVVLDKACVRYEPNDPEFIRITHRVYEHINEHKKFDVLSSTRFYGPMLFYLVWFKKCDNIVAHLLNNARLDDCVEVINLYNIVNEVQLKQVFSSNLDLIKVTSLFSYFSILVLNLNSDFFEGFC